MLLKSISIVITEACNLQCQHCDIWQHPKEFIDLKSLDKLLKDPIIQESSHHYGKSFDISLGGGEPFTHPNLLNITKLIETTYSGSLKTITSNGTLTKNIINFLNNNPKLNFKLNISIDGLKDTHDLIRGVKGSFDKTIRTIRLIKNTFPNQKIEIKMTIMNNNFSEIIAVYNLSQNLGCSFSCKPIEQMTNYTNRSTLISTSFSKKEILEIKSQLLYISNKLLINHDYKLAHFLCDIPHYLSGSSIHKSCSVLWEHITIMPNGDIFFCIKENPAGNIFRNSLDQTKIKPKDFICKSCMLMCGSFKDYNTMPYIERNISKK